MRRSSLVEQDGEPVCGVSHLDRLSVVAVARKHHRHPETDHLVGAAVVGVVLVVGGDVLEDLRPAMGEGVQGQPLIPDLHSYSPFLGNFGRGGPGGPVPVL